MKRSRELAELLLRKAAHDEYVFRKLLVDDEAPEEIAFFHAQQAVEKMIKAVLVLSAVRPPRVNDLAGLIDLARNKGISFPKELEGVTQLTPFAVYFRYEEGSPVIAEALHYLGIQELIRQTRTWAESVLRQYPVEGSV